MGVSQTPQPFFPLHDTPPKVWPKVCARSSVGQGFDLQLGLVDPSCTELGASLLEIGCRAQFCSSFDTVGRRMFTRPSCFAKSSCAQLINSEFDG
eukprot:2415195-Rhodomonas_salina.3